MGVEGDRLSNRWRRSLKSANNSFYYSFTRTQTFWLFFSRGTCVMNFLMEVACVPFFKVIYCFALEKASPLNIESHIGIHTWNFVLQLVFRKFIVVPCLFILCWSNVFERKVIEMVFYFWRVFFSIYGNCSGRRHKCVVGEWRQKWWTPDRVRIWETPEEHTDPGVPRR